MQKLTLRQTEDGGNASYRIDAVSAGDTTVKAYIMTADGELKDEVPLERVDADTIEVPDGIYVRRENGWHAKGSIDGSKLPEGTSTIVLILQRNGAEIDRRVCGDSMTGRLTASGTGSDSDAIINDMVGYACFIDNLSGMNFNIKKGKAFASGYVYSDPAVILSKISYNIDDGAVSGNAGTNAILKGYDRSDAAACRKALEDSGFTIGSKGQGCFAFPLNTRRLSPGIHEVTVAFMFSNGEVASYSTRFSITDDPNSGDIVKDAKTMLILMGYHQ